MSETAFPARDDDAEDLFEHAPCGYLSTLPDGTVVRANRTFLTLLGLRRQEVVGRARFQDLLTAGGRIFYETHYAPLLRMQGTVREIAVDFMAANGEAVPALINSTVKRDDVGRPVLIRTAVFHARDRREYERELVRARQRAEESEARSRSLAQTLQATFIPPSPPEIPGLDVYGVYRPAGRGDEVGGDFYDIFQTERESWAIVIGDVCGKGPEAAAVTALARYSIRTTVMTTKRPRRILQTLNEALMRDASDRFCTALYAGIRRHPDHRFGLTLASGGHPLPLLTSRGRDVQPLGYPGTVLGVVHDPSLKDASVEIGPGDVVAFYTDGVTEGRRGYAFFGEDRLERLLQRYRHEDAAGIARRIANEVVEFQENHPRDDIALVVLKVPHDDR